MQAELPNTSGVYQICCMTTGKIYVGSSIRIRERWDQHKRALRRGKHSNVHLQGAWDKYSECDFECVVLELVDQVQLLAAEQKWIDETRCCDRRIGFNLFETAGSPGDMFVQVWEGFVDPNGNEVTITNLFAFCHENNLDWASMHRLASGQSKLKSYKGWSHRNSVRKRAYIKTYLGFIDPEGKLAGPITNLAEFCRNNGLDNTHMVAVASGRLYSHQGWTYDNDRARNNLPKTYTGFINPAGEQVTITNLQEFCRDNNLHPVHMHNVKSGKRPSHKGWTWRCPDE